MLVQKDLAAAAAAAALAHGACTLEELSRLPLAAAAGTDRPSLALQSTFRLT